MRVVYTGGEGEITEKKSHFIACLLYTSDAADEL